MNREEFIKEVSKLGIEINSSHLEKLDEYYKILIEYNNHTNLTRITNEEDVYLKHFYDSLTISKIINLSDQKLIDVGTGAGFPGIVLKIFYPNLKITLLDSLNKRIEFLKIVIKKLGLKEIDAIHDRAEEYSKSHREEYDIVTSRAVAELNKLSELCIPLVKLNGYFIPMKGILDDELLNSENAIKTLGCVQEEMSSFELPKEGGKRNIIKYKKISKTSKKYPRKFAEIKKKPL